MALAFTIERLGDCTAGTVTVLELAGASGAPDGRVAATDAVFTTDPASRSATVTVCVPVHEVVRPGASDDAAQDTPDVFGSATAMAVSVTLPVLRTTKLYGIDSPMAEKLVLTVDFVMVIDGDWVAATVTVFELVDGMAEPPGGVPVTDAVFTTDAASRSAWVTV